MANVQELMVPMQDSTLRDVTEQIRIFERSFPGEVGMARCKRLNGSEGRRERTAGTRTCNKGSVWIFTEGEKTEPLYFTEIKQRICRNPQYRNGYHIVSCGTEVSSVVKKAEGEYRNVICREEQAEIFLVFDKDDVPSFEFDAFVKSIEKKSNKQHHWHAIWSSQLPPLIEVGA